MMLVNPYRYGSGSGFVFVADLVSGFVHGYSQARKLRSAYAGNILEVRRSSDATTSDIGFASNELNESALTTFVGANNGTVRTLYDQIGSRIIEQTIAANQPQIVSSGTVVKVSGKPYATYNGTSQFLTTTSVATPIADGDCTIFVVFESQSGLTNEVVFEESSIANPLNRVTINSDTRATVFRHSVYSPSAAANTISFASQQAGSTKRCFIITKSGTTITGYDASGVVNSTTSANTFSANTSLRLGVFTNALTYFGGKISELLINNTALNTTDRNLVLNNIKAYYNF